MTPLNETTLRPLLPACCAGDEENAGGPALGLQLIDFGRSLDLELLPPGTLLQVGGWVGLRGRGVQLSFCARLKELHPPVARVPCFYPAAADALRCQCRLALQGDSGTDAFRCVEMREGQTWLWQADAYGAAATVHTLLYGRYMEVERVRENATGGCLLVGGCCWVDAAGISRDRQPWFAQRNRQA